MQYLTERIIAHFMESLDRSVFHKMPFAHWILSDVLPTQVLDSVIEIPFSPLPVDFLQGYQRSAIERRLFFSTENRCRYSVCDNIAWAFQSQRLKEGLQNLTQIDLSESRLRIEYTQDRDGYFLNPHTDTIDPKKFTLVLPLPGEPPMTVLGTDLYNRAKVYVTTQPKEVNSGLIFIPDFDTWHGFEKKHIDGIRRLLIVNYVDDGWPHSLDLSFPSMRTSW